MVKEPDSSSDVKINVFLKDGRSFLDRDIPARVFGEFERVVSFWEADKVVVFPMRDVERIELCFGASDDN